MSANTVDKAMAHRLEDRLIEPGYFIKKRRKTAESS